MTNSKKVIIFYLATVAMIVGVAAVAVYMLRDATPMPGTSGPIPRIFEAVGMIVPILTVVYGILFIGARNKDRAGK